MAITLDGNNVATVGVINSATAKASTSGTSIDFTGIPSGVKRVTVLYNGVSTNGSSNIQIQIGSGSFTTTGYTSACTYNSNAGGVIVATSTTGFLNTPANGSAETISGTSIISLISSNTWVFFGSVVDVASTPNVNTGGGSIALSGTLDRVRITTVNGTDTFDAGSINILYE